jgi:hypothetical protein
LNKKASFDGYETAKRELTLLLLVSTVQPGTNEIISVIACKLLWAYFTCKHYPETAWLARH